MTRTHPLPAALLAALMIAQPVAAGAQTIVDATDIQRIAAIARDYGTAETDTDNTGDPMLRGEMEGMDYLLLFYGCTDGAACQSVQFYTYWTNPGGIDIDRLNAWNRDKRFAKAYIDDDGDPVLEMNVNLYAGVTETNLSDTFEWWLVLMDHFVEYIGLRPAADAPAAGAAPATRDAGVGATTGGSASRQLKSIVDWIAGQ